jgi:uncharacterized membrane protein YhhN
LAFGGVVAVHLVALGGGAHGLALVGKPVLAGWALRREAPRGLVAALLCGWGGDVLLEIGGTPAFLAGMGCFAAGHVCYLRLFTARGAFRGRGPRGAAAAYAAVWAVTITLLWGGLDPGMRVPVAGYSLLLTAMAAGAYGLSGRWPPPGAPSSCCPTR